MATSSPLGPVFANILLSLHEVIWLNNCPLEFQPKIYKGYVDDTFYFPKICKKLKALSNILIVNTQI